MVSKAVLTKDEEWYLWTERQTPCFHERKRVSSAEDIPDESCLRIRTCGEGHYGMYHRASGIVSPICKGTISPRPVVARISTDCDWALLNKHRKHNNNTVWAEAFRPYLGVCDVGVYNTFEGVCDTPLRMLNKTCANISVPTGVCRPRRVVRRWCVFVFFVETPIYGVSVSWETRSIASLHLGIARPWRMDTSAVL